MEPTLYCLHCGQPLTHVPSDSTAYRSDVYHCPGCGIRWKRIYARSATDCDSWMIEDLTKFTK